MQQAPCQVAPGKGVPKRVNMKSNQQSAAAEQGNYREKNACAQIAAPTWIAYEAKVTHGTHMADA